MTPIDKHLQSLTLQKAKELLKESNNKTMRYKYLQRINELENEENRNV